MTNQIPALFPTRDAAWILLNEFTQSPSLLKHALAVESCLRAYGEEEVLRLGLVGEDASRFVELYSATGLLHDFDYERHPSPEEHPWVGVRILEERGWPNEIHDVEVPGVRKKLKDKAFARGVNRDDVLNGAKELAVDLDQHIAFCLAAMQNDADALGLGVPQPR